MGDVFKRKCHACGSIIRLRESCAACAYRRRAELRARPDSAYVMQSVYGSDAHVDRLSEDMDMDVWADRSRTAKDLAIVLTAPARWAAGGVVGRRKAKRTPREFQVGDRVRWQRSRYQIEATGFLGRSAGIYDFCVIREDGSPIGAYTHELTLIEPAKPRYVDASEVREGDVIRARSAFSQSDLVYQGTVRMHNGMLTAFDENGWSEIHVCQARDIEILERAK